MNHDKGVIIDEMKTNGRKSHEEIRFSNFLPGIVLERIVFSPRSKFPVELFDRLVDLLRRFE